MLIQDKTKLLLLEAVNKKEVSIFIPTENEDNMKEVKGVVPHKVYDLTNGEVLLQYDYKEETVDLLPLADKEGYQLLFLSINPNNLKEFIWCYWDLGGSIAEIDNKPLIPTKGSARFCNDEETNFVDSILPEYKNKAIEILNNDKTLTKEVLKKSKGEL